MEIDNSSSKNKRGNKGLLQIKVSLSPLSHSRKFSNSSETGPLPSVSTGKNIFHTAPSPIGTNISRQFLLTRSIHSKSPSEFDCPINDKRPHTIVSRLNEEILILSSQLKQSNEIINYLNTKLNENYEEFETLKDSKQDLLFRNQELEQENSELKYSRDCYFEQKCKETQIIKSECEEEIKNIIEEYEEKINMIEKENKKQQLAMESRFIEIVMNLNHKYIEDIELVSKRSNRRSGNLNGLGRMPMVYSDKESEDASTFLSPYVNYNKKDISVISPMETNRFVFKKPDDDAELDTSLRQIFNQINGYAGPEKSKESSISESKIGRSTHSIIQLLKKQYSRILRSSFIIWSWPKNATRFEKKLFSAIKAPLHSIFYILTGFPGTLVKTILRLQKKEYFVTWRTSVFPRLKLPQIILNASHLNDLLKRKLLSQLHCSWKSLRSLLSSKTTDQRKKLKKAIEFWQQQSDYEEKAIEAFYTWKSLLSLLKITRLREFKNLFT